MSLDNHVLPIVEVKHGRELIFEKVTSALFGMAFCSKCAADILDRDRRSEAGEVLATLFMPVLFEYKAALQKLKLDANLHYFPRYSQRPLFGRGFDV